MIQIAFKMKIKPGFKFEYQKRHNAIWPEMKAFLKASGICEYSIFHDIETNTLFAVQHIDEQGQRPVDQSVLQKWWDYMSDIMEVNSDRSPVITDLEQLFHFNP
ncbi:L-rhamnose mutarotase [Pedobacter nutrimenti]|uniref:L-rhamnose mutarotase n=1 Tax=Pedobacter nutrimenti TaxID=1241337 RepID=UPI002930ADB5|nr:L-rhamnose mutarotase [Pedobacter nutrimenti]